MVAAIQDFTINTNCANYRYYRYSRPQLLRLRRESRRLLRAAGDRPGDVGRKASRQPGLGLRHARLVGER